MIQDSFLGSNINDVKAHNLRAILLSLLFSEPVFRAQLAEDTGLSRTTISNLVDELLAAEIVFEKGIEEIDGPRRVGRPRTAVYLNPDAGYALGAHIGVGVFRVGLVNLRNELLENELCWFDPKTPYEQVFEDIADRLEAIIEKSGVDRNKIIGLGVGPPGMVDYFTGMLTLAPNLNWENIPLRDWFSERMAMPVIVENNTRAMALAESYFGSAKYSSSLLFVYGRYGVGSGIVVDRQVFRGSRFSAGEIGHTLLVIDDSADCDIEKCVQLESLVSERALLDQAEEFAKNDPEGVLAVLLADKSYERKIDALIEAGRQGDPNAIAIFNRASRLLGIALTNLVNILNPERIVLGGMYWQAKDLILPTVTDIVTHSVVGEIGEKVIIEGSAFGWRAGLIGASTIALIRLFYSNSEEQ